MHIMILLIHKSKHIGHCFEQKGCQQLLLAKKQKEYYACSLNCNKEAKYVSTVTKCDYTEKYEMSTNNWYLNLHAYEIQMYITSSELPSLLMEQILNDNKGKNQGTLSYSQLLGFLKKDTFKFIYDQNDDLNKPLGYYLFFSDKSADYAWHYLLEFLGTLTLDLSSNTTLKKDIVGTKLIIMNKEYTIINARQVNMKKDQIGNDLPVLSLILKSKDGTTLIELEDGAEIKINSQKITDVKG